MDMTEHKPPVKIEDQAPALEHKQNASAAKANAHKCYLKLLERTRILDGEDEKLYAQLHDAILDDVKPQSFLEKIAVKDLVDKLFEELRGRAAIVGLIEGARHAADEYGHKDQREYRAIRQYLPHLTKLQRMLDNSEAGRRSIMKEFRRKAETSTKAKKPS
jgi:hypothetical protein